MPKEKEPVPTLDYATPPGERQLHRGWWGVAVALWVLGFGFFLLVVVATAFIGTASKMQLPEVWISVGLSVIVMASIVTAALTRRLVLHIEPIVIGLVAIGPLLLSIVLGVLAAVCGAGGVVIILVFIGGCSVIPGLVAMICGLSAIAAARRAERG